MQLARPGAWRKECMVQSINSSDGLDCTGLVVMMIVTFRAMQLNSSHSDGSLAPGEQVGQPIQWTVSRVPAARLN